MATGLIRWIGGYCVGFFGKWDLALRRNMHCTAAHEHPLLHTNPNLFLGSAGYGLTCLRMYVDSGDEFLLAKAVQVGEKLMRSRLENEKGYYWRDEEGKTWWICPWR